MGSSPGHVASMALALVTACCAHCGGGAAEANVDQLETEFWAAVGAYDAKYRIFRDRIVERGDAALDQLRKNVLEAQPWEWERRTMAWILIEWIEKNDKIRELIGTKLQLGHIPSPTGRMLVYGEHLAKIAHDTPMFLVEQVWKVRDPRAREFGLGRPAYQFHEIKTYAVHALGLLREKRSVPALIASVREWIALGHDTNDMYQACHALGEIGDPAAVPVLLNVCAHFNGAWRSVPESLGKCLDEKSAEGALRALDSFPDGLTKKALLEAIEKKKAEFGPKSRLDQPR